MDIDSAIALAAVLVAALSIAYNAITGVQDRRAADAAAITDRKAADDRAAADRAAAEKSADAHRQIMRELQQEQARPYVVASAQFSEIDIGFVEFVVRNYGQTAAHNVTIDVEPPLTTALGGEGEMAVKLPASYRLLRRVKKSERFGIPLTSAKARTCRRSTPSA